MKAIPCFLSTTVALHTGAGFFVLEVLLTEPVECCSMETELVRVNLSFSGLTPNHSTTVERRSVVDNETKQKDSSKDLRIAVVVVIVSVGMLAAALREDTPPKSTEQLQKDSQAVKLLITHNRDADDKVYAAKKDAEYWQTQQTGGCTAPKNAALGRLRYVEILIEDPSLTTDFKRDQKDYAERFAKDLAVGNLTEDDFKPLSKAHIDPNHPTSDPDAPK